MIRPDIVGRVVGETEDNIVSLFNYANNIDDSIRRYILILDDLEQIVGGEESTSHLSLSAINIKKDEREQHSTARSLSTFLTMMDTSVSSICRPGLVVVILCTAKTNLNENIARFDKVYVLENPNFDERKRTIISSLSLENTMLGKADDTLTEILDEISASTVGMSYSELTFHCRQALIAMNDNYSDSITTINNPLNVLEIMKTNIQSMVPASLQNGLSDGTVSMRVLTSKELLSPSKEGPTSCPLLGKNEEAVWKDLQALIVVPLCRAKALNELMNNETTSGGARKLCGGVLLTGNPGTGKSELARQCAMLAAELMPSVKLLEVSCTSLIHKEVGASERAIRRLFECARSASPCLVILDEVAIISSVRGNDTTTEGTMDRVLSTLLTELDGVDESTFSSEGETGGFAVIGVTQNVKWVDPALLRPGRLGKVLHLESPDDRTRFLIAQAEFKLFFDEHLLMGENTDDVEETMRNLETFAQIVADTTRGMAGASVIAVCNDAKQACIHELTAAESASNQRQLLDAIHRFLKCRQ